ncbi:hypothetical protein DFA_07099 [Cavenderia fasciculata]|uniref:Uncharacterized protein n=1 Tax=Cavenderia fasciculata TaxID=261658 RepID=F4PVH1_CACFS|nr:uncharacterized protein DFA_07099 [Cavenderia fasciculata]EGG19985.1 hypothetical protein DFA_07099 [Cavenderia fasciculata]|eukprot:XP_004366968.1 hypothetical protein DFA_07099 [Cavenderia fasciculata]
MNNNNNNNNNKNVSLTSSESFIFNDLGDTHETLDDAINSTPVLSLVNSTEGTNNTSSSQQPETIIAATTSTTTTTIEQEQEQEQEEEEEEVEQEDDDDDEREDEFEEDDEQDDDIDIHPTTVNVIKEEEEQIQQLSQQKEKEEIDNPFQLDNRKSRELYKTKILEKQKSLDNIPSYYSNKILYDKRHIFIKKLVNRVFSTLKSATSEDLLASQKNKILKELFRNLSSELDDSVLEYLQCDEFKQGSPIKGIPYNNNIKDNQMFASFSPLQLSETNRSLEIPPRITLVNEQSNSPMDVRHANDPIHLEIEKKSYTFDYPILDDKEQPIIYYYQLASLYLYHIPNEVDKHRHLFLTLYNNHWFFLIFSSLFYLWLLEYRLSLIPQVNVFIKATNRLFWHDNDCNYQRFKEVYMVIKSKLLDGSLWSGLNEANEENSHDPNGILSRNRRLWVDFYHIITVFYFYYEDNVTVESLARFRHTLEQHYTNSVIGGNDPTLSELSIDDIFVRGVIRHLYQIKSEEILIKYIEYCTFFKGNKPGSPCHMPRDVRVASRQALDILFPQGSLSRHTVNLFFRLLHPYYSTGSIVHWIKETIKKYLPSFFNNNNQ